MVFYLVIKTINCVSYLSRIFEVSGISRFVYNLVALVDFRDKPVQSRINQLVFVCGNNIFIVRLIYLP
jgi:hypothetical protein